MALVDEGTDAALDAAASKLGVDALLDRVCAGLQQSYRPEQQKAGRVLVHWSLATPDGPRHLSLRLTAQGWTRIEPSDAAPDVSVNTTLPTFLRLVSGRLNAVLALARGELQVSGDTALAVRQQLWFGVDLGQAMLDVSTPAELAQLVAGRSDAELLAGIAVAGVERTLQQVFSGMVEYYLPRKGPGRRAVIEFLVQTEEGRRVYQFIADPRQPTWHAGARDDAKVKVAIGLPDLLRLVSGRLDGLKAVAQGKLKVKGNLFMASGIQSWFDVPR